ncbi:amidase [Rhodalgimonas zhirmunskyi]|uniref:Amidase n=1 Tax=Rhodalgimonas zhirmunskyi TaxID=2964767 RepID=A0AAJ1U8V0_9RHOB|nr:amidase [Rhodoalgimonas zhirmunskyi]MDQ2095740.1 amidase [Rhodoalgimonas zhirmunskyi]
MDEIITWSAATTAKRLAQGSVKVAEVTRAHLDRIETCEPGLRAVVEPMAEVAMAQAEAMDREKPDNPPALWGLPVTFKINVDFEGYPNSNGLPALNDKPADSDAPVVANLKAGGAVPIGRTSTPEFSLRFFTSNPIYGRTLNPWDKGLTSGGSSGGASSAVASGMGVLGHGNDLGGSLRYPAYCCGLATLRPSMGRVPAFNKTPAERPAMTQMMSVQGVIAREVGDVKLAYDVLRRRSSLDPLWNGAEDSGRTRGDRPLRVGYCVDAFGDGKVDPDVARAVEAAVGAAKQAGYTVEEVVPPMAREAAQTWGELLNAETSVMMLDTIRELGSEGAQTVIDGYAEIFGVPDQAGFMAAMSRRLFIHRKWMEMFDFVDALILPVSGQKPFAADQDIEQPETLKDIMEAQRFLYIVNMLGLPGATVRTLEAAPVPLGVQIIGDRMDDVICMEVAHRIEKELALDLGPIDPR